LGDQIEKDEIGTVCIKYGGEERCIHGFGGEICEKETKLVLQEMVWGLH
jgi:hypothetical protein